MTGMNQEISLEERKQIQIEMLTEIDNFCRKNNLRYSLAYGTLIGAIRHKGFIPWDDDVDIMMPLPDMIRFKQIFKSDSLYYCDVDTNRNYHYSFSRIVHKKSFSKYGLAAVSFGICIDLYPVLGLPDNYEKINNFFNRASIYLKFRLLCLKIKNCLYKYLPLHNIFSFSRVMKRYRNILFQYPYETTKFYFSNGGELDMINVFDFDLFESLIDVDFEGHKFRSILRYDDYLRHRYGNYLQLPPVEQQVPYHDAHYYWIQ